MLSEDMRLLGQKQETLLLTALQRAGAWSVRVTLALPRSHRDDAGGPTWMPCALPTGVTVEKSELKKPPIF